MYHLKPLSADFNRIRLGRNHFLIRHRQSQPSIQSALERFLSAVEARQPLDKEQSGRGVYLLQGEEQWVLKFNRLDSKKKQLANFLGLKKTYGLYDLTNEFINLRKLPSAADFVPEIKAFGYRTHNLCFLRDEYLLVGYFANHIDVDARLQQAPEEAEQILESIFALFSRMLALGFCHLDPHPKNILIAPGGQLRLIDFECCSHQIFNLDFALGFLHGYFYIYWFQRFMDKDRYHERSRRYLERCHPELDQNVFDPVYLRFRDGKVSRKTRYAVMTSPVEQQNFLAGLTRRA